MTNLMTKCLSIFRQKELFLSLLLILCFFHIKAATYTVSTNSDWSTAAAFTATPTAADIIIVANDATLTVDVADAVCASLQLGLHGGPNAGDGTIVFNLNSQLTVSGAITLGVSGNARQGTIDMAAGGTLICGSLTFNASGNNTDHSINQGSGSSLTVNGIVQLTQPGNNGQKYDWNVNEGSATVSGLIDFSGTSVENRTAQIAITSGTLNANGGIAFAGSTPATKVITIGSGTLNIGGSGISTSSGATFTTTSGTANYNGSAAQVVGGYSYGNLTLSGGGEKTLAGAASVSGTLTLTDGNLVTTAGILLTLTDAATVSGGSKDSFIDGPIAKTGSTPFGFPVGDDGIFAPLGISSLGGSSTFTAEYFRSAPTDPTDLEAGIDHISGVEFWDIDGGVSASITLSWRASSSVTDLASLIVAHFDATSVWQNEGNVLTTGNAAGGTITSESISSFSPCTLGSTLGGTFNPLPVELLSFTAEKKSKGVLLEWETATEVNNAFFQVERSLNGKEFDTINKVEGVGNSDITQSYQLLDENPRSGINYYRLKQVDFDGAFEYHPIVSVDMGPIKEASLQLFPNPSIDKVTVILPSEVEGEADLVIYNALGQLVKTTTIDLVKGNNNTELDIQDLAKGRYTMIVNYGGQRLTQAPLMIQR